MNNQNNIRIQDDFYEAINGEWIKKAKIPSDRSSVGAFSEIHLKNEKALIKETNELIINKKSRKNLDSTIVNYANFAEMAQNFKRREMLGVQPILPILKLIMNLTKKEDLLKKYKYFSYREVPLPFEFGIIQDFKNVSDQIMCFSGPKLILPEKSYYEDSHPLKEKLINSFVKMSHKLLKFYFNDEEKNQSIINKTLSFDRKLVDYSASAVEMANYVSMYNIYNMNDLNKKIKNVNVKSLSEELVNRGEIKKTVEKINVIYPKFIDNLDIIFNDENFDEIKSWMFLKTIIKFSMYLNEDSRIISGEFERSISGQSKASKKEKSAFYLAYGAFNIPFGTFFAKKTFGEKAKKNVENMVESMINIYKKRLSINDWLSEQTRLKGIEKLENLGVHIGYPEEIQPYFSKYKIKTYADNGNLLSNALDINVVKNTWQFNQYQEPINRNYWGMSPAEVNAYYSPFMNHIVFPAAILNKPFYSIKQSESANFGGIGAVIAHEISHAFDNNGAQFDKDGNLNSWWTDEDFAKFNEKGKKMIELFDNRQTEYGKCNGKLTVSENIADAGGISCSLEAVMLNPKNKLEDFFINWAIVWRGKFKPETAQMLLSVDVHAPQKLRANVQVQNLDEFYSTFNVKSSDNMWLPKAKRVKIW
ncbi:M13-type metalloendopeptidase [Mycoplasma tauri]|uniref:M13-type metalloendopeptidase n=1 Tax=Mycoplasma tauri TaxID=547987 RepID=UPI001CBCD1A1|nr:M13-type metalloendopeptidase [Mycoplasma tauri]MBZ4203693.1 M13 family peptidase [Mycoplasma tauri]